MYVKRSYHFSCKHVTPYLVLLRFVSTTRIMWLINCKNVSLQPLEKCIWGQNWWRSSEVGRPRRSRGQSHPGVCRCIEQVSTHAHERAHLLCPSLYTPLCLCRSIQHPLCCAVSAEAAPDVIAGCGGRGGGSGDLSGPHDGDLLRRPAWTQLKLWFTPRSIKIHFYK